MKELEFYLKQAVEHQASDLFFVAGGPVCEKVDGLIRPVDENRLLPPDTYRKEYEKWKIKQKSPAGT